MARWWRALNARQNSHCRKHHRAPLRTLCDSFLPVRWRLDLFVCSRSCPPKPLHGPLVIAHHCFLNTSRVAPLFMGFLPSSMGFPDSSKGKESACNAGDHSSIPGSGRSAGINTGTRTLGVGRLTGNNGMKGYRRHRASQEPHPHPSRGSRSLPRELRSSGAPSSPDPSPSGAWSTLPGLAYSVKQEVCSEARDGRGNS